MSVVRGILGRLVPALTIAAGVVIVTAGLMAVVGPVAGYVPAATDFVEPTPSGTLAPGATPEPTPGPTPNVPVATRVVVPALRIDLAVLAQTFGPGHGSYPLCDVAQYLEQFNQPSEAGTTYIYAHARTGMFLPLLTQWQRDHAKSMTGDLVMVYTADDKRYLYEIFTAEIATNFDLARSVPAGASWLILQTSTGPNPTFPKLMVAARLLSVTDVPHAEANPVAHWRDCRRPGG
jgi:hypothetical protein